jgi:hypothetical protein
MESMEMLTIIAMPTVSSITDRTYIQVLNIGARKPKTSTVSAATSAADSPYRPATATEVAAAADTAEKAAPPVVHPTSEHDLRKVQSWP